jgi:hypothetical protein
MAHPQRKFSYKTFNINNEIKDHQDPMVVYWEKIALNFKV